MRIRRKAWTEPALSGCPYYIDSPSEHRGHWRELFEKDQPLHLEIGCGKGIGTVKMTHDNPNINYIAVDEVRHVLAVLIRNAEEEYAGETPKNLILAPVNAEYIHDTFSQEDGIERIYINFCNPWDEKAKHHKRRLTHPRQLAQYRTFLAEGGEIWFKTDNEELFSASRSYFAESSFEITYETDDLHASGFSPNYVTEHEAMFTQRGMKTHFLIAKMLPSDAPAFEPVSITPQPRFRNSK